MMEPQTTFPNIGAHRNGLRWEIWKCMRNDTTVHTLISSLISIRPCYTHLRVLVNFLNFFDANFLRKRTSVSQILQRFLKQAWFAALFTIHTQKGHISLSCWLKSYLALKPLSGPQAVFILLFSSYGFITSLGVVPGFRNQAIQRNVGEASSGQESNMIASGIHHETHSSPEGRGKNQRCQLKLFLKTGSLLPIPKLFWDSMGWIACFFSASPPAGIEVL